MQAIAINGVGGLEVLERIKLPIPSRSTGTVLVKVSSTAANQVDNLVRAGVMPVEKYPAIMGKELAGVVAESGEGSKFKKGDRVAAYTSGAWAEYAVVKEESIAKLPSSIPLNTAGGIPVAALTSWQALHEGDPKPGKRVLVHAAAGGVGSFAVQFAKALGMFVVGTSGPNNLALLRELGADEVVNYRTDDVAALYKDKPFDLAIDSMEEEEEELTMGKRGNAFANSLAVLKPDGHLSHIAGGGTDGEAIGKAKADHAAGKGPSVSVTISQPNGEQLGQILALMEQGKVKLIVDRSLPLFEKAGEALAYVETGHARGKVVLVVAEAEA